MTLGYEEHTAPKRIKSVFDCPYVSPGSDYAKIHRMINNRGTTACGRRLKRTQWMAGWDNDVAIRRPDLICEHCKRKAAA